METCLAPHMNQIEKMLHMDYVAIIGGLIPAVTIFSI